ncbi:MAG: hypothetical protein ACPLRO_10930, partial [Candidatus Kapaibacteriota bacterium]
PSSDAGHTSSPISKQAPAISTMKLATPWSSEKCYLSIFFKLANISFVVLNLTLFSILTVASLFHSTPASDFQRSRSFVLGSSVIVV